MSGRSRLRIFQALLNLAWGSFPCQDLSLAGAGAGLKGDRSGTFWPFWNLMTGLIQESRAPRLVVLENVCGTLTSHEGKDFRQQSAGCLSKQDIVSVRSYWMPRSSSLNPGHACSSSACAKTWACKRISQGKLPWRLGTPLRSSELIANSRRRQSVLGCGGNSPCHQREIEYRRPDRGVCRKRGMVSSGKNTATARHDEPGKSGEGQQKLRGKDARSDRSRVQTDSSKRSSDGRCSALKSGLMICPGACARLRVGLVGR